MAFPQPLPETVPRMLAWMWDDYRVCYEDLERRQLSPDTLDDFLRDWSQIAAQADEVQLRLRVATAQETGDAVASARYAGFIDTVFQHVQKADHALRQKLLAADLALPDIEWPLRRMRADVETFCEANVPLAGDEQKLVAELGKILGAQTVSWDGRELSLAALRPWLQSADRHERERAWRAARGRELQDRAAINRIWTALFDLRQQMTANLHLPTYRDFRWRQLHRFDYSPADCLTFAESIEGSVVPEASRWYETRRRRLSVETLRPWDLETELYPLSPARPVPVQEFVEACSRMFTHLDRYFVVYLQTLRAEQLLDLESRPGKAPVGFTATYFASRRPFIFLNLVGLPDEIFTLMHECGHAFHAFESSHLPYLIQRQLPMEAAELAAYAMELLAAPYLAVQDGGPYAETEAARLRLSHLLRLVHFWPFMAMIDQFQHWAYTHPSAGRNPDDCDRQWARLSAQFMPDVDWTGVEDVLVTGWQRKVHPFGAPFYYVEYGMAQLGAVQIWDQARNDLAGAIRRYREAMSRGGTESLTGIYRTAGSEFAFDRTSLQRAVSLLQTALRELTDTVEAPRAMA